MNETEEAGGRRSPTPPTLDEIRQWGATCDIPTAGSAFGFGRNKSYDLAKAGDFPVRILKIGASYRVVTSEIVALLEPKPVGDE